MIFLIRVKSLLQVIVESHFVWIDKLIPGIISFELTSTLFLLVNASKSLLVSVRDLVFGLLIDLLDLVSIDICARSLHLELFENGIGSVNNVRWLIVLVFEFIGWFFSIIQPL